VVVSQQGTGIYSTGTPEAVEPVVKGLLDEGRVAVLTIDKPGISVGVDGAAVVRAAEYEGYTQSDLVSCLEGAVSWALGGAEGGARVILSGHSEGAEVVTSLYERLLVRAPAVARAVRLLVLSGVPLDGWRSILDGQLSADQRIRFWGALRSGDAAALRGFGGLTPVYVQAVLMQRPLAESIWGLARRRARAAIRVYQGEADRNTRPGAVHELVEENGRRRAAGRPALDLQARFYAAGHGLNQAALADIRAELDAALAGPP
jgi:hypothetical protein